ncbi:uncharacterized protein TNCV_2313241 [Trichonephila clavipes]|nr:uncharacterized protein TNCV_2313241 [Trichonephila clavipes]
MELKCRQHVTLSEARRRFRASNSENLSTVLKSKSQENNIQELIDKKFEKMMTAFQTVVEKQTAFLMEILQKSMETMLSQDKSLPVQIIRSLFDETVNRNFQDFYIIATDASKNEQITSIAGIMANSHFAYRINHNNSIFIAEALAICQALDDLL